MNRFPENLKRLRLQRGYTQNELAEQLFVQGQSVSRWENGESQPSIETLLDICALFRVTMDELITDNQVSSEAMERAVYNRFSDSEELKNDLLCLSDAIIKGRVVRLTGGEDTPVDYYRITDRQSLCGVYSKKHGLMGFFDRSKFESENAEGVCGLFKALSDRKIVELIFRCGNADGWYDKASAAQLLEISQAELNGYYDILESLGVAVKKQLSANGNTMEVYSFCYTEFTKFLLCVAENILPNNPNRWIW